MPRSLVLRALAATIALLSALPLSPFAHAENLRVATASNFLATLRALVPEFENQTGIKIDISAASTGKLYAQIRQGAPYDVFLAADQRRPLLLEQEGYTVAGSRFTYALGELVLLQSASTNTPLKPEALKNSRGRLAIANPKTAPYGDAARAFLIKMKLWKPIQPRLIRGENIGQTFQFVSSGNAALGLVAHPQVLKAGIDKKDYTLIDAALYPPLTQQAALLSTSKNRKSAERFIHWLQQDSTRKIIRQHGYSLP